MFFSEVLGLDHIKNHLITSVQNGRIPHAQLFVGQGVLPLAIAYSQYLLCGNSGFENSGGNASCNLKFNKFSHPDLHFVYPVAINDKIKKHPISNHFAEEWRNFLLENPYGNLFDWYNLLGIENKQGNISVDEAQDIVKSLSLKSYEGGYKVMIIWMAEKMNIACANKLLKILEEPPEKTVFILIAEDEEQLLTTIKSRCQLLKIPLLSEEILAQGLVRREHATYNVAKDISRQASGDYNTALNLFKSSKEDHPFEDWVIFWIRSAFKAKGNKSVINDLLAWSDVLAGTGRETQKKFLDYCISFFRQAMLLNYKAPSLVYLQFKDPKFALEKFAPFIHGENILDIIDAIEAANYHIERNGNAKIIFTDLSIQLTRLLHKTP
ncbi:MAG: DNA polymerase III subunit delta' [Bacteroidetes bacterium HGW-Bacteroidetes-2]|jgi:DNA polymerase-3 subunit delta'|nr:MAG: DNA polymerase III subunit delta' [Bacteroidetes bacterium HGW-Bacteroidetes-2]